MSCPLDPILAKLFTGTLKTWILSSHASSTNHCNWTLCLVLLLLKKPQPNIQNLNIYRPVSELPYIFEVFVWVVAVQIMAQLLQLPCQDVLISVSTLPFHQNTPAYMLKDILMVLDQGKTIFSCAAGFMGSLWHCQLLTTAGLTCHQSWFWRHYPGLYLDLQLDIHQATTPGRVI